MAGQPSSRSLLSEKRPRRSALKTADARVKCLEDTLKRVSRESLAFLKWPLREGSVRDAVRG